MSLHLLVLLLIRNTIFKEGLSSGYSLQPSIFRALTTLGIGPSIEFLVYLVCAGRGLQVIPIPNDGVHLEPTAGLVPCLFVHATHAHGLLLVLEHVVLLHQFL